MQISNSLVESTKKEIQSSSLFKTKIKNKILTENAYFNAFVLKN